MSIRKNSQTLSDAHGHSGRTDSSGGHHDRKTGGYHYHNSGSSGGRTPTVRPTVTPPPATLSLPPVPRRVPKTTPKRLLTPRFTAYLTSGVSRPIVDYREEGDSYWITGVAGGESRFPKRLIDRFEPIAKSQSSEPIAKSQSSTTLPRSTNKTVAGKVVGITDGDTLTLLVAEKQYRIRLAGIDCPEKGQPFGTKAMQALSNKVFGKTVTMLSMGKDRYGRILGVVFSDGCVNAELVREGLAWHYKFRPPDTAPS